MRSYLSFDLELSHYRASDGAGAGAGVWAAFRVRVTGSPVGEQKADEAAEVTLGTELREEAAALAAGELSGEGLLALGRRLGEALLPPAQRRLFERSLERLGPEQGLRLRLAAGARELAELPWEYAYLPPPDMPPDEPDFRGFAGLQRRLSIVRYEQLEQPVEPLAPLGDEPLRLVALTADPVQEGVPRLDLASEARILERVTADNPDLELHLYPGAELSILEEALAEPAHIFHFAGHGVFELAMGDDLGSLEGKGYLLFEGPGGAPVRVPAERLALNLAERGVRLAVLTACEGARRDSAHEWSGVAPVLVHQGLPAVVAMQYPIRDDNAVRFAGAFYECLAEGRPVDAAVTAGRLAVYTHSADDPYAPAERDWGNPVLYLRATDGVLFPDPDAAPAPGERVPLGPRFWVNTALSGVLLLLAALYFVLHLAPRIPAGLAVGGVSLGAVVAALFAWLQWVAEGELRDIVRSFFRRRSTTLWLGAAAGLLAAACLATSSVHLVHKPPEGEAPPVVVRIESEDLGLAEEVELGAGRRVWSRTRFGRLRPAALRFEVKDAPLLEARPATMRPAWSLHLAVPGGFDLREPTVVLFFPKNLVRINLQLSGPGRLRLAPVEEGASGGGGATQVTAAIGPDALFLGAGAEEVKAMLDTGGVDLKALLGDELTRLDFDPDRRETSILTSLKGSRYVGPELPFDPDQKVRAEIMVPAPPADAAPTDTTAADTTAADPSTTDRVLYCAEQALQDLPGTKVKIWILDEDTDTCSPA